MGSMSKVLIVTYVAVCFLGLPVGKLRAVEPAAEVRFPLSFGILDPQSKEKQPPYIVMFDGGLDANGRDVRRPLGRLEALRGASRMFPQTNQDPGLTVVLRGLRFLRSEAANGGVRYEVELLGEYNAVRVPVVEADMKTFLAGERTSFHLTGQQDYRIYAYASSIKMEVQLRGEELLIFQIDGDFSFREARTTYVSKTKKLAPPMGRKFLYRGEKMVLPSLPVI
jgi:hypothetical protein